MNDDENKYSVEGYDDLKQGKFSLIAERKKRTFYYKSDEQREEANSILTNYYNTIAEFYEFLQQEYYSKNDDTNFFSSLEERIVLHSYGLLSELELTLYHTLRQENIHALERLETAKIFYTKLYFVRKKIEQKQKNIIEREKKEREERETEGTTTERIKEKQYLRIIDYILAYSYITYNLLELQILYNLKNSNSEEERKLHSYILQFKKNFPYNFEKPEYDILNSIAFSRILLEAKDDIKREEEQKKFEEKQRQKQRQEKQKTKPRKIPIETKEKEIKEIKEIPIKTKEE